MATDSNEVFVRWTNALMPILQEFNVLQSQVFQSERLAETFGFSLAQLALSCAMTSESTVLLVREGNLWDADILIRSVLEGTMKFIFLSTGDRNERSQRTVEFSSILPDVKRIRRHLRVIELLSAVPRSEDAEWGPLRKLRLSEEDLQEIMSKFSKQRREALDQKWSFTNIIKNLAASEDESLKPLLGFLHFYGLSSNIIHKDADGVGMVWERMTRPDHRRKAVELAHGARALSDIFALAQLRIWITYKMFQIPFLQVQPLLTRATILLDEFKNAEKKWRKIEYGEEADSG